MTVADGSRDAYSGGAHAQGALELLDHRRMIGARQHGDKAKTIRMLPADRCEPIVHEARRGGVTRSGPADIERAHR